MARRLDQRRRERGAAARQLDDQRADVRLPQRRDVGVDVRGGVQRDDAGGEHELAPGEHPRDVRDLADVHPAHGPGHRAGGAGADLRLAAAQRREREDVRDGREHALEPDRSSDIRPQR
jgi:hypothetical protein